MEPLAARKIMEFYDLAAHIRNRLLGHRQVIGVQSDEPAATRRRGIDFAKAAFKAGILKGHIMRPPFLEGPAERGVAKCLHCAEISRRQLHIIDLHDDLYALVSCLIYTRTISTGKSPYDDARPSGLG